LFRDFGVLGVHVSLCLLVLPVSGSLRRFYGCLVLRVLDAATAHITGVKDYDRDEAYCEPFPDERWNERNDATKT
jgi:hypothetical protein